MVARAAAGQRLPARAVARRGTAGNDRGRGLLRSLRQHEVDAGRHRARANELEPHADKATDQAIADWHHWMSHEKRCTKSAAVANWVNSSAYSGLPQHRLQHIGSHHE